MDSADIGGHVESDRRQSGYRRVQPRVDSAPVADHLYVHALGHDDRDAVPSGIDVQVDHVIVELGLSEVKLMLPSSALICAPGDLPASCRPQPPQAEWISSGLAS